MFKQFKPTPKFWSVNFYLASGLFMSWFALLCATKFYSFDVWVGSLLCIFSIQAACAFFVLALIAAATEQGVY